MANSNAPLKNPQTWRRALLDRAEKLGKRPMDVVGEFVPLMVYVPPPITGQESLDLAAEFQFAAQEIMLAFSDGVARYRKE